MDWQAPSFTRISAGAELGYTNEHDREPAGPARPKEVPARTRPARRARAAG